MAISASAHAGDPGTVSAVAPVAAETARHAAVEAVDHMLPLLDLAVLEDLEEELGVPEIARKFANDYALMWVRRQHRLAASVQDEDQAAAVDAAISLKVSSAMIGGSRLAHLAGTLEAVLRLGDLQAGAALVAAITIQGKATVDELRLRYGRTGMPEAAG